nr:hypothetical protein [Tanacetum cinerariifolium]
MANTTPIVTTVTKTANKEKTPNEADAALKANILDSCEEHYEDNLLVIMDKIRHDKRKEVHVRLGHQRQSACDRLSNTYSPSTTKSGPDRASSMDRSHSRGRPRRRDSSSSRDRPRSRGRPRGIEESYGNTCPSYGTGARHRYHARDRDRSRSMKRGRESESSLPRVSKSGTSDEGHWKSKSKRRKPIGDPEDHVKILQAAAQVERWLMPTWCHIKKYVKDPVEIHNIKQNDGETVEDFMERFKVETGRMKGASECMRIFGFMHGVSNPELTKRLNEHVPKTMEEMMTANTAFKRGETAAASKKKGHTTWKSQDQPKRIPKEILATEEGKFKPPPPMVTPVEKRSSNKFCDFHNDKGHSTNECVQLKKQIEELVRAGKLSHLIKEIKQGRDQPKVRKKEVPAKDKSTAIYMVQSWHRMTRQKVTQSFVRVKEITFPPLATSRGIEGPLVIEAEIGGHMIHRMYVDGGSLMEKMQNIQKKAWMNFMIVRSLSPYNGIIERPTIREIQAVPSTTHKMLKFPVDGGIVTIRSTILIPTKCAVVTTTSKEILKEAEVCHENFKVALHPNFSDQEIAIEGTLSAKRQKELCSLLKKNLDIFAWQPSDMTGVPRLVAKHQLNIREGYLPVRQKKRGQASERAKAIQVEIQKLVEAGIMREVYYHDWFSIPVMVKKHDGSWRMCVDFTDLNKACYHQTQMAESDKEKTTFHTSHGVYCYTKMPFGLKNAGATYHRLVDKAFNSQVGWNIEVYGEHNITYRPRTSVKGQILTDFLVEKPNEALPDIPVVETPQESWTLFTDGSSCVDGSEYEALIAGLQIVAQMGVRNVHVSVDSKLVANQVLGTYVAKEENMIKYLEMTKSLVSDFANFSISQVPRSKNKKADTQSKNMSTSFAHLSKQVLVKVLKEKSIQEKEVVTVVEEDRLTWMTPIMEYLKHGTLSEDKKEANKLRVKARQYELLEGVLYRRSFLKPWMRKVKFLIDAMDYFTKWIEAKAVVTITGSQVKKFVWDNIVCLFGLLGEIVSDNGKQFNDNAFKDWCEKLNITQRFASVKHPQSNGLVKRANMSLGEGIKARLGGGNKNWIEELPHIPWAHRTMIKSSHGDTPFSLTYGTEAVVPAEIRMPTHRNTIVDAVHNDEELLLNLGFTRRKANEASHAVDGRKLDPKWEGPYEVTKALEDGAYKLRSMEETVLPQTWNIANLKKCYL